MTSTVDPRPLTHEQIKSMTIKEFIDHMMTWEEVKDTAMGDAHLPWMEYFYPDGLKALVKLNFEYINDPKPHQLYEPSIKIVMK